MPASNVVLIAFYEVEAFGVRTLHAVLRRAGVPVKAVFFKRLNDDNNTMDPATPEEIATLLAYLRELDPMLVGLSVRSGCYPFAADLTRRIKEALPATLVLWGGIQPTVRPQACLEFADAVCIGEGEEALSEVVERLGAGQTLEGIRNIWYKRDGQVIEQPLRPLIANLSTLPILDFLGEDMVLIEHGQVGPTLPLPATRETLGVMTSRGCPYSCTYCSNSILRQIYTGQGAYVRRRSVEHVMEELLAARAHFPKLNYISFFDDVFTFDRRWIERFTARYRDEIGIPFFCYCHPKVTTDETIAMLREAGASTMTMGIQSGSQRTRNEAFKRNDRNDEIVRAAQILARHGIHCSFDIIMDNPLEEDCDRRETLDLLLQLPRPFELHTHTLTHFPQTDLTRTLLERGMIAEEEVEDSKQKGWKRWTPTLDLRRDRENLFWDNLYFLASRTWLGPERIRQLSRSALLRRFPRPLTHLLRWTTDYGQTIQADSRFDRWRVRLVAGFKRRYYQRLKDFSRPLRRVLGLSR